MVGGRTRAANETTSVGFERNTLSSDLRPSLPRMADPLIGLTINFTSAPSKKKDPEEAPRGGLGSQVLPVADLGEDFDGQPVDGSEYLFMVRSVGNQIYTRERES